MPDCPNPACFTYPWYGIAPHWHEPSSTGTFADSTRMLPRDQWPAHFHEDPDVPGMGTYRCPFCGSPEHPHSRAAKGGRDASR